MRKRVAVKVLTRAYREGYVACRWDTFIRAGQRLAYQQREVMRKRVNPPAGLRTYVERRGVPVRARSFGQWEDYMNRPEHVVARTMVGTVRVVTLFLGIAYAPIDPMGPILYETRVSGGMPNDVTTYYRSRSDALLGHAALVARLERS